MSYAPIPAVAPAVSYAPIPSVAPAVPYAPVLSVAFAVPYAPVPYAAPMNATSVTAKPRCAVTSMGLDASLMFTNVEIGGKRFASALLDSRS